MTTDLFGKSSHSSFRDTSMSDQYSHWMSQQRMPVLCPLPNVKTIFQTVYQAIAKAPFKIVLSIADFFCKLFWQTLYGYGSSTYGQVGAGACIEYTEFTGVSDLTHVSHVTCGRYHTLATDRHGRLVQVLCHIIGWYGCYPARYPTQTFSNITDISLMK